VTHPESDCQSQTTANKKLVPDGGVKDWEHSTAVHEEASGRWNYGEKREDPASFPSSFKEITNKESRGEKMSRNNSGTGSTRMRGICRAGLQQKKKGGVDLGVVAHGKEISANNTEKRGGVIKRGGRIS